VLTTTAELLACPRCNRGLRLTTFETLPASATTPIRVLTGKLECDECGDSVPICAGFPLFCERSAEDTFDVDALRALSERRFGDPDRMLAFVQGKARRPSRDRYAAFQPFNESTRAFLPLVPLLRERLEPGDRILDIWCRTGWSGELLAALFPEQQVLSIWEGGSDVLGHRGFGFWLGEGRRSENLDVIFTSPNEPLPFGDATFALVHGLDTLHRYEQSILIPETLRVCSGPVIFPHVHLSNGDPDPFFERGEIQMHGSAYRQYFADRLQGTGRTACVLSERELYEVPDGLRLEDDAETDHYNALIAIVPHELLGRALRPEPPGDPASHELRPIANPLLATDLHTGRIAFETSVDDDLTSTLLSRHPMQSAPLKRASDHHLDTCEVEILYAASQCLTLGETAANSGRSLPEVTAAARRLADLRIIELRAVSEAMARLQHFYSQQIYVAPASEQTIARLFEDSCRRHATRPLIVSDEDGSCFRYEDAARVVQALADRLQSAGVVPGDRVCLYAAASPEALFTFWACALVGAIFVPLDCDRPAEWTRSRAEELRPRVLMLDRPRLAAAAWPLDAQVVVFDDDSDESLPDFPRLSEWLASHTATAGPMRPTVAPDDPVAILHTSGTTGRPKQVLLSHGTLFRSGELLARICAWKPDDVLSVPGDLHTMSGLRNPCVAALHAGAAVVTAAEKQRARPLALADLTRRNGVTILCTVPAVLRALTQHAGRLREGALRTVRQVLSTGCRLPPETSRCFRDRFGIEPFDYYGATETTGISIGTVRRPGDRGYAGIGHPLDCIARIVSDDGRTLPANERGSLRIFSNRLMLGYADSGKSADEVLHGGWYDTGDLAMRDASGQIHLVGRRTDFLKNLAGERVALAEIEAILMAAPGVADAVVCRRETAEGDEEAIAFVVPDDEIEGEAEFIAELQKFALERLGPLRVPRHISTVQTLDTVPARLNACTPSSGPGGTRGT